MKNTMMTLLNLAIEDEGKKKKLEDIYTLYDQLQYSANIDEMAIILLDWLHDKYEIDNMKFSLFDMESEKNTILLTQGEEFFLDDPFSSYFIINTHTDLNAVISFSVDTQNKYDYISDDKDFLDATFFLISPLLQNGIIKKHHIESSSIDSVTNVHTRQYLIERIQKIIALSKTKEASISFLMIGIDRFKAVIEEFDYDVGDEVLVELAKVIYSVIKDFDIVARLTGDEFLVALVNLQSIDKAEEIAKKIVEKFANTKIIVNSVTKQTLQKTICVGISSFPEDGNDINQVLKNADNFLYEAKNKGRNSVAIYEKDKNSSIDLF